MYGAILGDMIGAPYEFDRGSKTKEFPLFVRESHFTDDTVMTIAVAEALLNTLGQSDDAIKAALVSSMQAWGRKYPNAGYGGRFRGWLHSPDPHPYGSYGNGSAMRVAAAGWLFDDLEMTRHAARLTAEVTHNHPEGIKGAEATAAAIWMARSEMSKAEIKDYIIREFGYNLSRTCDEIRPTYHHDESCQRTVPEAITAFLEGTDFEDVIRTAVSLGGDCDTLACIAGSIAEAFYGVQEDMIAECRKRLPADMLEVVDRFQDVIHPRDIFLIGNEMLEQAISYLHVEKSKRMLAEVLRIFRERMHADGHFILPVIMGDNGSYAIQTLKGKDGQLWYVAFTSQTQFEMGSPSAVLSNFIDSILKATLDAPNIAGLVINPWGNSFSLTKEDIEDIFKADAIARMPSSLDVPDDRELFFFNRRKFNARGYLDGKSFIVLKGSQMNPEERKSCREGIRKHREELISTRKVVDFVFVEDTAFPSPSSAASIIAGGDSNGLVEWKDEESRTLKEHISL